MNRQDRESNSRLIFGKLKASNRGWFLRGLAQASGMAMPVADFGLRRNVNARTITENFLFHYAVH